MGSILVIFFGLSNKIGKKSQLGNIKEVVKLVKF